MDFRDLVAPVRDLAAGDALSGWRWLIGGDGIPRLLTALGDVFIQRKSGQVCFLDTYEGRVAVAGENESEWKQALQLETNIAAWFAPDLIAELRQRGLHLAEDQTYSPIIPLVLGGRMEPGNFECTNWSVHLEVLGQIYEQARRMRPGTPIKGVSIK